MELRRYYRIAALYPSLAALLLTTIYSIIDNLDYKSEWLNAESVTIMGIGFTIVYCGILCVLCLPVLLADNAVIQRRRLWTALSWFLPATTFIVIVFTHEIRHNLAYNGKLFDAGFIYTLLLNFPFLIGLTWSYFKFRKDHYPHE